MPRIAFLGLGRMGTAMASRLTDAGHELVVWNRSPEKTRPFRDHANATIAASPADATSSAEFAITMLTNEHALRDVLLGDDGVVHADPPPRLYIDMSTVGPEAVRELAAALAPRIEVIDAPVRWQRAAGAGRRAEDLRRGAAARVRPRPQLAAIAVTIGEALALGRALGIEPQIATDTLADTYVGGAVRAKRPLIDGQQMPTNFPLHLAAKDLRLVTEAAHKAGITLSSAEANRAAFDGAATGGLADADYGAIIPFIRDSLAQRSSP